MARKVDPGAGSDELRLPYESDVLAALVRIMTVLGSAAFQRELASAPSIPDDANAIPALYGIATLGPRRPSSLAAYLHVSAPTVSRLVEKLAAAGLVTRMPDPDDSRASLVALTPAGAEVTTELFRVGDALMGELLSNWSDDDRSRLGILLSRLAADLSPRTP
ncbi:MarR family winged helix-turn-helix transcriptional regulator [Schumannella luteola]|jgi:DNA-binding MarR family transcriptional regulator